MSTIRIALANIRVPASPEESVVLATSAVAEAGRQGALVVCFPECFVPGYRWPGTIALAVGLTVILGAERVTVLDLSAATGLLASRCRTSN